MEKLHQQNNDSPKIFLSSLLRIYRQILIKEKSNFNDYRNKEELWLQAEKKTESINIKHIIKTKSCGHA